MQLHDAGREVRRTLARIGIAETELGAVGATIGRGSAPPQGRGLSDLPPLALAADEEDGADLVVRGEIGRGGMGVVRLAEQRSIGREVAIKTAGLEEPSVVHALVREGRIMGALEHPSLVPIHALGAGRDGAPVLVMKRVDGVPWRELLRDGDHPAWAPLLVGHEDRLHANVEILSQLCRALAFAHEQGVVHLDLKPENVMIGRFGEVVLLDWGIAIRLSERDAEPERITGTPGYLAPEMARADARLVDERTDVYLLGATLYEVLAGRMIHDAPTPLAAITSALLGEIPPIPSSAPSELAQIVERACSLDPEDRPPTVEAFREALEHFLATRNADALVSEAREALELAASATATEGPASASAFRALIEARFALTSAQRMRPGDESIGVELERAVEALVERELALRSPEAARALLAELASPPAELERAIDELSEQLAAERAAAEELEAAKRAADASAAVRPLSLIVGVGLTIALVLGVGTQIRATMSGTEFAPPLAFGLTLLGTAIVLTGLYLGRRALLATAGTRRLVGTYVVICLTLLVSDIVSYSWGVTVPEGASHAMTAAAMVGLLAAITHLRDLWPMVPTHAVAVVAVILLPAYHSYFVLPVVLIDAALFVRAFRREGARSRAEARTGTE